MTITTSYDGLGNSCLASEEPQLAHSQAASGGQGQRRHNFADHVTRPVVLPLATGRSGTFQPNASILILGIRGTGKTSLGVFASTSLGYRLVDADQRFLETTGFTRAAFASSYGSDAYRRREIELMQTLLEQHPTYSVIVCGPGSAEGTGQGLLRDFGKRNPIIYVARDPDEVNHYLRTRDLAKITQLERMIRPAYRLLSSYEFFNLSQQTSSSVAASPTGSPQPRAAALEKKLYPTLILKDVEDDFLRLIYSIKNHDLVPLAHGARHSLAFLAPEFKPFTYVLSISISQVAPLAQRFRTTDLIVDAVELTIEMPTDPGSSNDEFLTFITRQYYLLRRSVKLPLIFHVLFPDSGSSSAAWSGMVSSILDSQTLYFELLAHGLRLAPEYLVVDLACDLGTAARLIANRGPTKVIGHHFDANPGVGAWESPQRNRPVEAAQELGCDIVRLCQPATSTADNMAVQRFVYQYQQKCLTRTGDSPLLIAYNTGGPGRGSVLSNPTLTPVTHELLQASLEPPPRWMLTVTEAQKALYASFALDRMTFGIFGAAVSQSLSPEMQNAAFGFCGMPHVYQQFQHPSLSGLKAHISDPNFGGASITSPFKKEVFSVVDYLSPEAQAIGAVNTLIPLRDRSLRSLLERNRCGPTQALYGDNTDWIGIHACIRRNLSPVNAVKGRTTALILGAGGMAQGAVYALIRLGIRSIFIWNRTPRHAQTLAHQFHNKTFSIHSLNLTRPSPSASPGRPAEGTSAALGAVLPQGGKAGPASVSVLTSMDEPWPANTDPPTIIVSCISYARVTESLPRIRLPPAWLSSHTGGVVIELAYDSLITPLLAQIQSLKSSGWIAVDGLQVLPEQGAAQFELFTGRKAPRHLMRDTVQKVMERRLRG